MDRGDRLEAIYLDDEDRELFLKTLGQASKRAGWRVHSYVLMKNRTVVGHEWILDRLEMGHRSNVTRAMAGFRNGGDRETRGLKAKIIKCSD